MSTNSCLQLYIQTCNLRDYIRLHTAKVVFDRQLRTELLARVHVFLMQLMDQSYVEQETHRRISEFIASEKLVINATEFDAQQHIGSLALLISYLEQFLAKQLAQQHKHN